MRKYGSEKFTITGINSFVDKHSAFSDEQTLITENQTNTCNGGYGYNMTDGGEGCEGYKHTKETKQLISERNTGRKWSEKSKKEFSKLRSGGGNPMYNKNHSADARKQISASNKGKQTMLGKHHSAKSKEKISKTRRGSKNPMYGRPPWLAGRTIKDIASTEVWSMADEVYVLWINSGRPGYINLKKLWNINNNHDVRFVVIIKWFIENGDPSINDQWVNHFRP
jgi:group I intron endonuclease